jgi:hypothetical protein
MRLANRVNRRDFTDYRSLSMRYLLGHADLRKQTGTQYQRNDQAGGLTHGGSTILLYFIGKSLAGESV